MPDRSKISFILKIKQKVLEWLKLRTTPVVKTYNGYGNAAHCILFGHALLLSPLPRKRFRHNALINTLALLRLFMVRPFPAATVKMEWEGMEYYYTTETDGFFRFEWSPGKALPPGWHSVRIELLNPVSKEVLDVTEGKVLIPFSNQFAFVSDIDDTFLISHSSNVRKRLYVILTKNADSRKPFDGVVHHYQLLAAAHAPENTRNPFFYVSSSEWNLYNYIRRFCKNHAMPDGIYLLGQIKRLKEVFKTGQNKHTTKFMRIARLLEAYPHQVFVLLGDDSQEDPNIYASLAAHFKDRIFCVYIRQIEKKNERATRLKMQEIESDGIHCCYCSHSKEAVAHSKAIGLLA
ncbi:MAG TPA: phosphatase domain-containing protein [Chitinophaga sp.]